MAASLIVLWNDYDMKASWRDFTDHDMFTNHDPERGRTLYGAEVKETQCDYPNSPFTTKFCSASGWASWRALPPINSKTQQALAVLTATLASIGAAGVPGVGMITLALVLKTIGVPLEGIALILGVDRLLDMCRTVVNVTGAASCASVVAETEGEELSTNTR